MVNRCRGSLRMSLLYALLASLGFGVGDFAATVGARRHQPLVVAFVAQGTGFIGALVLAPFITTDLPSVAQCGWAAAAGLFGAGAFAAFLWSLANGPVGVVAPVSAVISVIVPIAAGLFEGERPSLAAWIGVVVAVSAILSLSMGGPRGHVSSRVLLGAIATGLGFGVFYVLFDRAATTSNGLWPVVMARAASVGLQLTLIRTLGGARSSRRAPGLGEPAGARRPLRAWVPAGVMDALRDRMVLTAGALDTTANAFLLYALSRGRLSIAAVIISLYPASTIILARTVLHEHLRRLQIAGLVGATVAIALVSRG